MNEYNRNTVGVDISKAYLDVHRLAPAESARFDNHRRGFEALAKWVGPSVEAVIYEPTGPWHRDFEEALAGKLPRVRVNPMRARRFAQAKSFEPPPFH
ncbi:MAG: hypothetical protein OXG56_05495 [Gammaproteobacteria bacterium]|nr:hypothetical protein [Gammaproteobacteria bacterium]